jgi:hypothetical protein
VVSGKQSWIATATDFSLFFVMSIPRHHYLVRESTTTIQSDRARSFTDLSWLFWQVMPGGDEKNGDCMTVVASPTVVG